MEGWLDQCRVWCKQAKFLAEELDWNERQNHAGALRGTSPLLDQNRVSIPGLVFEGELQRGNFGLYQKYAVMHRAAGRVHRVFTLEVYPFHKRSHRDESGEIFGPHLHLGDDRIEGLSHAVRRVLCNLDPSSLAGWIARFRRHTKISEDNDRRLAPPYSDDLFGLE